MMKSRRIVLAAPVIGFIAVVSLIVLVSSHRSAPPAHGKIRWNKVRIEKIDTVSKIMVVRTEAGKGDTIAYSEESAFHPDGKPEIPATQATLKAGDSLMVVYMEGKVKSAVDIVRIKPRPTAVSRSVGK